MVKIKKKGSWLNYVNEFRKSLLLFYSKTINAPYTLKSIKDCYLLNDNITCFVWFWIMVLYLKGRSVWKQRA